MLPLTKLFINGEYRPSSSEPSTFEVLNPFSHQVVGLCSTASSRDCHDAIEAANKALASWENTTPWQRRDILLKAADLISTEKYKRALITGQREETAAADGWGESFVSGSVAGAQVVTQRRALGVILAIAPWNAALTLILRTIAVPILCGNTIVFKSSELSPRSQAIVADLFAEVSHRYCLIKWTIMDLLGWPGGSTPRPPQHHLDFTRNGAGANGRDHCPSDGSQSRRPQRRKHPRSRSIHCLWRHGPLRSSLYVRRTRNSSPGRRRTVGGEVKRLCEGIKAGDPSNSSDPSVKLGALFSEASARNVVSMMQEAVDGGARLVLGDLKHEGSVVQPHLLADVDVGMRLWKEESFGPGTFPIQC
ncbi:Vanillin dehydrogenase [Salix suchowensis]|nr:Vanillin dehydrogenase [Salix suchowensis]